MKKPTKKASHSKQAAPRATVDQAPFLVVVRAQGGTALGERFTAFRCYSQDNANTIAAWVEEVGFSKIIIIHDPADGAVAYEATKRGKNEHAATTDPGMVRDAAGEGHRLPYP